MATTKAGLEDVIAANSAICDIIGAQGKLTYRGIDIHDLARNSSFEETTYLLWFGSLPTRDALHQFNAELASHRALPTQVLTLMKESEHGAALVTVVLFLPVLILMPIFAIDVGNWFEHHRHLCSWRIGLLSTPPMLFGLPPAVVSHPSCALRGDDECAFACV